MDNCDKTKTAESKWITNKFRKPLSIIFVCFYIYKRLCADVAFVLFVHLFEIWKWIQLLVKPHHEIMASDHTVILDVMSYFARLQ